MSHTRSTASSSSNFQVIINNALKVYNKRTKNDLLQHPLAAQIQTCQSPADILAVLQQQVQGLDREDRWTKWLGPTINVLLTFSQTAGTVGLVCPRKNEPILDLYTDINFAGIFTGDGGIRRNRRSSFSE